MKSVSLLSALAVMAVLSVATPALAQHAEVDAMVAQQAKANLVPETLVHRIIQRESKYQPALIGHGGAIGLMQIKLETARGLGYKGTAEGLRDPLTNLTYAIKYLAGAYRAAYGDHDRTVSYYAGGYYYVAKQQRLERAKQATMPVLAEAPKELAKEPAGNPADARAEQLPTPESAHSLSAALAIAALTPPLMGLH
jgi:soluble lytic murein transglycosylase-like protein